MKITWASNAPWTPTGYGTQTAQMLPRLLADGHDVIVAANYGLEGHEMIHPETGVLVHPKGVDGYGRDVLPAIHGDRDLIITLYDAWIYNGFLDGLNVASWTPVDHYPVPPEVLRWASTHPTIAMSQYGRDALKRAGVDAFYAPHALDLSVWKPTPSDFRAANGIPADAFLVMINAANKGKLPLPRKAWPEMLMALKLFLEDRPDAYAYIHADISGTFDGIPLLPLINFLGLPGERVVIVDQALYAAGRFDSAQVAAFYTASDVLLSTSMGEGFGLAVIEAQACGTPVIVTDFSAQPELVGAGWTVPFVAVWDYTQGALLALPSVKAIVRALNTAREAKGDAELRTNAIAKAAEYDADKVYAEHWRPILAKLADKLTPPTRQQRRAKRRKAA